MSCSGFELRSFSFIFAFQYLNVFFILLISVEAERVTTLAFLVLYLTNDLGVNLIYFFFFYSLFLFNLIRRCILAVVLVIFLLHFRPARLEHRFSHHICGSRAMHKFIYPASHLSLSAMRLFSSVLMHLGFFFFSPPKYIICITPPPPGAGWHYPALAPGVYGSLWSLGVPEAC